MIQFPWGSCANGIVPYLEETVKPKYEKLNLGPQIKKWRLHQKNETFYINQHRRHIQNLIQAQTNNLRDNHYLKKIDICHYSSLDLSSNSKAIYVLSRLLLNCGDFVGLIKRVHIYILVTKSSFQSYECSPTRAKPQPST